MGVAARVAGWKLRLGGSPGPFSAPAGSGDSPNGSNVEVELFIDGTWVDITSYVMTRDGSQKIQIFRGQADEGNRTDPGRCTFQLNNRDGRFSPRNPVSPYYGLIGRNTPIRVSVPSGNEKSYRFWGEVASWPPRWDTTGTDVWVELEAAGILRRLGQGQTPLKSPMRREFSNPTRPAIVAYWPCEDGSQATQVASGLAGGTPMTVATGVTLAAFSGWVASDPLPTIGAGSLSGAVAPYPASTEFAARFFLHLPEAGVPSGTPDIITFFALGTAVRFTLYTDTNGALGFKGFDAASNLLFDSGLFAFGANGINASVGVELTQSGADINWRFFAFRITATGIPSMGAVGGTLVGYTFQAVSGVQGGAGGDIGDTAMGHIALANAANAYANTSGALIAWNGEDPNSRISRLCREEQITYVQAASVVQGLGLNSVTLGPQGVDTLLNLVVEAIETDSSILYEPTDVLAIGRRSRLQLYVQPSALPLDYEAFNLSEVPTPVDDDQRTRNDVTVRRPGGSFAQAVQEDGPLSVNPPPAGVGRYDTSVSVNIALDSDLPFHAGWRLLLGTVDEARFPQIVVNLAHPSFGGDGVLRRQALAVRPGDRVTIANPPAWLPPDDVSQLAIGFAEEIDNFQHRIAFTCVPESPYRVSVLEDATFGKLDSDTSFLVDSVSSSAVSLLVSTVGVAWTTDAGQFPFDVGVGGERMTVTAVASATSPQAFTVTRSVNGVVKGHSAGAQVRLWQPMVISL